MAQQEYPAASGLRALLTVEADDHGEWLRHPDVVTRNHTSSSASARVT